MASSYPSSFDCLDQERPNIEFIRTIVLSISQPIQGFLSNPKARKLVKSNCFSKLKKNQNHEEFFEFSEQSILSNLYWGIESFEAAVLAICTEERSNRLKKSEEMLQSPALLEEHGVTAGVPNNYLVCCSYFYLSAIRELQGDHWQAALHFLQALSVSPKLTQTEFAPKICRSLLRSCGISPMDHHNDDEQHCKLLRNMARGYKAWLTYYQVMSYNGSPLKQFEKVHPLDNQESNLEEHTGRLGDMLKEYQSDSSVSVDSNDSCFEEEEDDVFEVKSSENYKCFVLEHQSAYMEEKLYGKDSQYDELMTILEKTVSKLCFSDELIRFDRDYYNFVKVYGLLSNKNGVKYTLLKDIILDQLLAAISTSKEVGLIRASVSILSTLVSGNKSVIEQVMKKGLQLRDLANALKKNVQEAAVLIYLTNPSPIEIKTLEILPSLVEIICTSSNAVKGRLDLLLPTPYSASLMIIEVLVTTFDNTTNNMHLAAINAPRVLAGLLDIQSYNNMKEYTSLATILIRCMQFDGKCRKYISEFAPVAPFIHLLSCKQEHAMSVSLKYFHEILRMPRSSANKLLRRIIGEGNVNTMHTLFLIINKSQHEHEHKLLAANLLLQLDMLGGSPGKSIYREEALEFLLESVTSEPGSANQKLSAFLLSNLSGTYSWSGQPYIVAWLLKKTGLSNFHHQNMIRNFNWLDESMQDADLWCSKIARILIKTGEPVFRSLENGLRSGTKMVYRDCLAAIAWIGCEIVKCPEDIKHKACDILLNEVQKFLHPGLELEERLLACLCIYKYTSGKGMQKLIHFSEGVRESLRRLSTITWIAEELLRAADYFHPNKWRISCVHTQVVEASQKNNGAVTALIYYKGLLYSGYSDGSIKGWEIKGQTATLISDVKDHRKTITCFTLFEAGNCLLSASMDKTIRMWQMVQNKLECIEVIGTTEPIQSLDSYRKQILAISLSHEMKVFDTSSMDRDITKAKNVKCMKVIHGKVFIGCMDSSIWEIDLCKNQDREIKPASKVWKMQSRPISSIAVYKEWLYCSSLTVEGSSIKEWRRQNKPHVTIVPEGGNHVQAMEIVEDFIYINCNQSPSTLQIWLRGTQQKVGRLSAGKNITSLLVANDMVLCGTETGVIKGWIPL
ncbi:putative E3 ubiquitin-protein ligase LIN-1 [Impatiens glandulifera]|uniref:putative E3 ubiquitin-protein ligase LIN-1 n=1 Tax=Impatiens glandulifera TaxID=253017 RepID=UPI001FB1348B|nr:putative E3 ubiquitin-protein ligase LIN-1 [Impatiens glandulifera]